MIISETLDITISQTSMLNLFDKQTIENIKEKELEKKLVFYIPLKYSENKEKTVYKVGFLVDFLKFIYPEKSLKEIYEIININYQVFINRRQMERNYKEYILNPFYRNQEEI